MIKRDRSLWAVSFLYAKYFERRKRNMGLRSVIEKIRNIATEANDYEKVDTNIVIIRNSDGSYTEVTSDEDN